MHRISFPHILGWSLLLLLGLHTYTSQVIAQPPAAGVPTDDEKSRTVKVPIDHPVLVMASNGEKIKSAEIDPSGVKVAKVEAVVNNPNVLRITGLSAGKTYLTIIPEKGPQEIKIVHVQDTDEELFQVERKKLEKRREILLAMIRQTVPTANVDVILGLQRSRVAVGAAGVGGATQSGPNDNTILTGTVILTGIVFEAEKIHTIVDLTNAVFGGVAQPVTPNTNNTAAGPTASQPGQPQQPQQPQQGTLIGPNNPTNLGNRITIINSLRLAGVQQVELAVVMAVVNRSEARNMGFNWFNNTNSWFLTSFVNPALGVANGVAIASAAAQATGAGAGAAIQSPPQFGFGVLNQNNGFAGFLQALRSESLVKILAEPRLLTMSGRQANFLDGGQIPVITSSTSGSSTSFLSFGTQVNFVPIVLGNGKIHLEVAASISQPSAQLGVNISTAGSVASAPGLVTRGAQVAVQLEDGQTLAIGGLIQNTVNSSTAKIPVLGDLPYFGAAFRSVSSSETEEELLILVTPRLVDPMACSQLKPYPGRETRSADDYELFLEGIMELPRSRRDVFQNGRYVASHKMEGANTIAFPCGDAPRPRGYLQQGCANGQCATGQCATGQCATGQCATGQCNQAPSQPIISNPPTGVPAKMMAPLPQGKPTYVPNSFDTLPPQSGFTPPQSGFAPPQSGFTPQQSGFTPPQSGFTPMPQGTSAQWTTRPVVESSQPAIPVAAQSFNAGVPVEAETFVPIPSGPVFGPPREVPVMGREYPR